MKVLIFFFAAYWYNGDSLGFDILNDFFVMLFKTQVWKIPVYYSKNILTVKSMYLEPIILCEEKSWFMMFSTSDTKYTSEEGKTVYWA